MSEATELKIRISENELEAYLWLPIPQDESGYTVNGLVQKLNEIGLSLKNSEGFHLFDEDVEDDNEDFSDGNE